MLSHSIHELLLRHASILSLVRVLGRQVVPVSARDRLSHHVQDVRLQLLVGLLQVLPEALRDVVQIALVEELDQIGQ